jgi:hypothetical protein
MVWIKSLDWCDSISIKELERWSGPIGLSIIAIIIVPLLLYLTGINMIQSLLIFVGCILGVGLTYANILIYIWQNKRAKSLNTIINQI